METSGTAGFVDGAGQPANTSVLAQALASKKNKKKKKQSPKEKALEKLDKSAEEFLANAALFNDLIQSLTYWLKNKSRIVLKLLNQQCLQTLEHDQIIRRIVRDEAIKKGKLSRDDNSGKNDEGDDDENDFIANSLSNNDFKVNYDDFKLVTTDLDIPCSSVQLHALCKLLDPGCTGFIDYRSFTVEFMESHLVHRQIDGLWLVRGTEKTKYRSFNFKSELAKNFGTKYPLYVKLDLKMLPFEKDKEFHAHLRDEIVYTHMKIFSLVELIRKRTDIASNMIQIFTDASKSKASQLEDTRTLESYGFQGGDYNLVLNANEKITLFYDYKIYAPVDPIINCDFYFHKYKLPENTK